MPAKRRRVMLRRMEWETGLHRHGGWRAPLSAVVTAVLALMVVLFSTPAAHAQNGFFEQADLPPAIRPDSPIVAQIGVDIRQITSVDQLAENFGVVMRLRMTWSDPRMAFDPDTTGLPVALLDTPAFLQRATDSGIIPPHFTVENQQSRSFSKYDVVSVTPAGDAEMASEVILTLQAPDFDFRRYPFDQQTFFVRLVASSPVDFVQFEPLQGASGLGETLGEEEWRVLNSWTEVDAVPGITGRDSARFSFGFLAERNQLYYWARIFVPLLLLVSVSWANLFLEDYRRRIEFAGANLLAFIAFNLAISSDLPRLGYMTFLDAIMLAMFFLTALTVVYNVALQRLKLSHHEDLAVRLDRQVTYWGYPGLYAATVLILWLVFFT